MTAASAPSRPPRRLSEMWSPGSSLAAFAAAAGSNARTRAPRASSSRATPIAGESADVVGARLEGQPEEADGPVRRGHRAPSLDAVGESVLLGCVGVRCCSGDVHRQATILAGHGQRHELLGQATPAEPETWPHVLAADARIERDAGEDLVDVGAVYSSASPAISFVKDSFRARNALAPFLMSSAAATSTMSTGAPDRRRARRPRSMARRVAVGEAADHDPRRMQEVLERRALPQELRVGQDQAGRQRGPLGDHAGRAGRQRAADDERRPGGHDRRQAAECPLQLRQVAPPVRPDRRPDADHHDLGVEARPVGDGQPAVRQGEASGPRAGRLRGWASGRREGRRAGPAGSRRPPRDGPCWRDRRR